MHLVVCYAATLRNWQIVRLEGVKIWSTPTLNPASPKMVVVGDSRAGFSLAISARLFFGASSSFGLGIFLAGTLSPYPLTLVPPAWILLVGRCCQISLVDVLLGGQRIVVLGRIVVGHDVRPTHTFGQQRGELWRLTEP